MNIFLGRQRNYVLVSAAIIAFFGLLWLKIALNKSLISISRPSTPGQAVEAKLLPITTAIIAYGMGYYDVSSATLKNFQDSLVSYNSELINLSFYSQWKSHSLAEALETIKHLSYQEQAKISGAMPTIINMLNKNEYTKARDLLDAGVILSDLDRTIMPVLNAWILYATGDKTLAFTMLEEEASFDPFIAIQLALMHDLNNSKNTGDYYKHALEINPGNQFISELVENFSVRKHDAKYPPLIATVNQAIAEMLNDFAANLLEYQATELAGDLLDYAQLLNKESHYSWLLQGVVAYQQQDFSASLDAFAHLKAGSNEYFHAAILRLNIALDERRLEDATYIYREISKAFPEDKALVIDFAAGLLANDYYSEVVDLLAEKDLELDESLQWDADYLLAVAYQKGGDPESGASLLVSKLRDAESDPLIFHYLGEYLLNSGEEIGHAVSLLAAAYNSDPYNPEFQASYGIALEKTKQYAEALPILLEAISLIPDHKGANIALGNIYAAKRNMGLSQKYWRQAGGGSEEEALQQEVALLE